MALMMILRVQPLIPLQGGQGLYPQNEYRIFNIKLLGQYLFDDVPAHIGESTVDPVMLVGEPFVIQSKEM